MADPDVERVERLHRVELVGGDVALAQRRHAEVDDAVLERGAAEAAGERLHRPARYQVRRSALDRVTPESAGTTLRSVAFVAMRFEATPLAGAWSSSSSRTSTNGCFARTFCDREFADHGLPTTFPQCNLSRNTHAGTLRGMHFNIARARRVEARALRARGDLRRDRRPAAGLADASGSGSAVELSADDGRALFVPAGFAHGFLTLVDDTDVDYQMGEFYEPEAARGLRWNDPAFGIDWPREPAVMSRATPSYPDFDPAVLDWRDD